MGSSAGIYKHLKLCLSSFSFSLFFHPSPIFLHHSLFSFHFSSLSLFFFLLSSAFLVLFIPLTTVCASQPNLICCRFYDLDLLSFIDFSFHFLIYLYLLSIPVSFYPEFEAQFSVYFLRKLPLSSLVWHTTPSREVITFENLYIPFVTAFIFSSPTFLHDILSTLYIGNDRFSRKAC